MVPRPGQKDNPSACEPRGGSGVPAAGQLLGFVLLSAAALAIFAAIVLIPAWSRHEQARYERDLLAARREDARSAIETYDRLIEAAPGDQVLTKRLARHELGLYPRDEVVVIDPGAAPAPPPGAISYPKAPRPDPPPAWLVGLGNRLSKAPLRRGLLLMAAAAMLAALFLFTSASRRPKA